MNDNEFYLGVFKVVAATFVLFTVCVVGSCQATKLRIVDAIEAGASPLSASCAMNGGGRNACAVLEAAEAERVREER